MADRGFPDRDAAGGVALGPSRGRVVLVVGPSGAGKDSLIRAARERLGADPRFVFPRRLVTRPASEAEDNEEIGRAEFDDMLRAGAFAAAWTAHGHGYGLPAVLDRHVVEGRIAVCNVSRTVIGDLRARYAATVVISVTAPPEVLARRLAGRRRDGDGDLGTRLARSGGLGPVTATHVIDNAGEFSVAAERFVAILRQEAERACPASSSA